MSTLLWRQRQIQRIHLFFHLTGRMGKVVSFKREPTGFDKRRHNQDAFVRGQQVLANAIFHWKNDPSSDAQAAVRFLLRHIATAFRADDSPLQPRAVEPGTESSQQP